jgi:ABC-type transporter Mla MlaB component
VVPGTEPAGAAGSCILLDDGALRITGTGSPRRLAIAGEIDEHSYPALVAVLENFTSTPGEIHLSLAEVQYCDLAGLRAIVRFAADGGDGRDHDGRQVIVHELPAHLKTVLQILGWDCAPGLVVAEHHHSEPAGTRQLMTSAARRASTMRGAIAP